VLGRSAASRPIPTTAAGDNILLAFAPVAFIVPIQAVASSLMLDYVARVKLSGSTFQYVIVRQLAWPQPDDFQAPAPCPMNPSATGSYPVSSS
jgi:hypothetical protein